jgi:hypothetical protein
MGLHCHITCLSSRSAEIHEHDNDLDDEKETHCIKSALIMQEQNRIYLVTSKVASTGVKATYWPRNHCNDTANTLAGSEKSSTPLAWLPVELCAIHDWETHLLFVVLKCEPCISCPIVL